MALPKSLIESKAQDTIRAKAKLQAYKTWASKPGNLEEKARKAREQYHYRASLGICPRAGCSKDVFPDHKTCRGHWKKKESPE